MAAVLIGALVLLVVAFRLAVTGQDNTSESLPDFVDRLIPTSGAEVLRQSSVGIDVANGYDGYLVINGVTIATAQDGLVKELGTGLIQFTPGPGRPIESLDADRNCVVAMVWKASEGQGSAKPVSWCFTAT